MDRIGVVLLACALAGCGPSGGKTANPEAAKKPPAAKRSLYARLGGQPAIEKVTTDFVARLAADPRVMFRFANSDVPRLTADLVAFVCVATGGACEYRGREMKILHASMQITEAEWDATVEALVAALDAAGVPPAEKREVLTSIGGTKADIVDPPEPPPADELKRIDAAAADLTRYGASADLMGAAFAALRAGQRSYADQLFSMAEASKDKDKVRRLAKLFRAGAPPRIGTPLKQLEPDTPAQPTGSVGASDDDLVATAAEKASLAGTLTLTGAAAGRTHAVVMLTPTSGKHRRKRVPKQRSIEQRGREFAPRLMAIPVGSTVSFPNFDPIYHNVFSRSDSRPFDLGIYRNGQARSLTFERPGIVRIGCNLHANMAASIIVVGAPHYAVTDGDGRFHFKSLRPGRYKLEAWTDRSAEPVSRTIDVAAGENSIAVDAAGDAAPGPGPDKFGAPRGEKR